MTTENTMLFRNIGSTYKIISHKPDVQKLNTQIAWLRLSDGNVIWHEKWGDKALMMIVADAAAVTVVMSKVNVKDWSSGLRRRHYGIMGR